MVDGCGLMGALRVGELTEDIWSAAEVERRLVVGRRRPHGRLPKKHHTTKKAQICSARCLLFEQVDHTQGSGGEASKARLLPSTTRRSRPQGTVLREALLLSVFIFVYLWLNDVFVLINQNL